MKKNIIIIIAVIVVVSIGSFFLGMLTSGGKCPRGGFGQNGFNGVDKPTVTGLQNRAGAINGEIIAKDDVSITVKMRDGGSKIVLYSTSTEISKFASGTLDDLVIGETIMVSGQTNQDGSVAAKTIQLRPQEARKQAQ
jgi:hypothetical protein